MDEPGNDALRAPRREPTWWAAVGGVLVAAAALAVADLVAVLRASWRSPVAAVGDQVVDRVPGSVRRWAIDTFGTADKAVLVGGTVVVVLLAGAALGVAARRGHRAVVAGGVVGLAVLGLVAARWGRSGGVLVPTLAGTLVAASGFAWLARSGGSASTATTPPNDDRRRLVVGATVLAATTAGALAIARPVRRRVGAVVDRLAVRLPAAAEPGPTPPADPAMAGGPAGLSPLFTPSSRLFRIDTALSVPTVRLSEWRLRVDGLVDRPFEVSYDGLLDRPLVEADVTLACVSNEVGGDLVGTARWLGLPLADLLAEAGVRPEADQVVGHSLDGFTAGFPVDALDGRPALVAVGMNGEPLPLSHGFPARLVVAGLYGYVSATKWLRRIELTRFDTFEGYWVPRGWAARAPIKAQSRIDTPRPGRVVPAGPVAVAGVAWAPMAGVGAVEVQVDGGPWRRAELGPGIGPAAWRQWWLAWDAPPGRHELRCRVVDAAGAVQTAEARPPAPDGATGHHQVTVEVG